MSHAHTQMMRLQPGKHNTLPARFMHTRLLVYPFTSSSRRMRETAPACVAARVCAKFCRWRLVIVRQTFRDISAIVSAHRSLELIGSRTRHRRSTMALIVWSDFLLGQTVSQSVRTTESSPRNSNCDCSEARCFNAEYIGSF